MKKVFSALLALCMVLSMTAFAELATDAKLDITVDKTEVVAGDTITFTVKTTGDSAGLAYMNGLVKFDYDPDQLTVKAIPVKSKMTSAVKFSTCKVSFAKAKKTVSLQLSANNADAEDGILVEENLDTLKGGFELGSFTATVNEGATGTIKFSLNADTYLTYANELGVNENYMITYNGAVTTNTLAKDIPTITVKGDEPEKPVISVDPSNPVTGENNGIVDINTNAETGAYSVKVKAPIGKKAVIYLNGEAQTGSEIADTATKDITIKVEYVDVTDEVITYVVPMSSIYGAEDGIAAFGKGTITEGVEYGIKFGGLKGEYKGITDYKFPAAGNVGGIFGVEVKDAPAGDYKAQAYVGDAMDVGISFTK